MNQNKFFEIGIASFALILFVSSGYLLRKVDQKVGLENVVENYIMPRPKALLSAFFNLGDREVEREYVNPFEKTQKNKAVKNDKAAEIKNPQAVATNGSKSKAKTQKSATAQNGKKPNEVSVSVVEETQSDMDALEAMGPSGNYSYYVSGPTRTPQSPVQEEARAENKSGLGPEQWRALLQAQPTEANLEKFMAAYASNEFDAGVYYSILGEMLDNSKSDTKGLGLKGLRAFPSLMSFQMLVDHEEGLQASHGKELTEAYKSYEQTARVNVLLAAMQTRDAEVVTKAIQISVKAYQASKNGNGDGRGGRGDINVILVSFSRFIPVLQTLASGEDAQVAQLASGALSQFQVVAAN